MKLSASKNPLATPMIALALGAVSLGASLAVNSNVNANEFVVSSQVVSDEAAASSSYVGDISNSDAGVGGESIVEEGSMVAGGTNERTYGQPDLFYNYYTQGNANRANAQMYVSPGPVPARVGHTFYTYQPFYPQEYLYHHTNKFHNYYDNGRGMNRTKAVYYSPPVRQAISNLYWNKIRLPR
ncbi:hypothetical protein [Stieleria marina]